MARRKTAVQPQRVKGGAAAQARVTDALAAASELAMEIRRWGRSDWRLAAECLEDLFAVIEETQLYVDTELRKILERRDQAADDDIRARLDTLEQRLTAIEQRPGAQSERAMELLRKSNERR